MYIQLHKVKYMGTSTCSPRCRRDEALRCLAPNRSASLTIARHSYQTYIFKYRMQVYRCVLTSVPRPAQIFVSDPTLFSAEVSPVGRKT